jgi:hypothetical protein
VLAEVVVESSSPGNGPEEVWESWTDEMTTRPAKSEDLFVGPIASAVVPEVAGSGHVRLEWDDGPSIRLEIQGSEVLLSGLPESAPNRHRFVLGDGRLISAAVVRWDISGDRHRLIGNVGPASFGVGDRMSSIQTRVVNFSLANREEYWLLGHGWSIHLKETGDFVEGLPGTPGAYAISQDAEVRRDGREMFSEADAVRILEALDYFLSLARGAWVGHVNVRGFNRIGRRLWERWETSRVDRSGRGRNWAADYDPEDEDSAVGDPMRLRDLWDGFLSMWQTEELNPTLRAMTSAYIETAAHTEAEAGLLIGQVLLELLSWAIVVNDRMMVSAEGHDKLGAADRIRLLLAVIGMPGELGADSQAVGLARAAETMRWVDGPHAVTELRNALVHPVKRKRLGSVLPEMMEEARDLTLQYAEAAMEWWLLEARRVTREAASSKRGASDA